MKQFRGYDDAKKSASYNPGEKLPVGAYVCTILGVRFEEGQNSNSDVITIQFDIAEGDYKDFFQNQYKNNTSEDKKYKGMYRIYLPKDDGTEQDGWTKNAFARWTTAFEKSNPNYFWDWDESKWKGKKIGIIFGTTGTVIEGKEIVYVEPHMPCSVDEVRNDTYYKKATELKKKKGYTGNGATSSATASTGVNSLGFLEIPAGMEEDLPFN